MRFTVLFVVVFLSVASVWNGSDGWRRRRRWWRATNCEVNGWGGWGGCSNRCGYGYQYRRRFIWRYASWGGRGCPHLSESRRCGRPNGGCQQICSGGRCYCYSGYYRYSYYYCADTNECGYNSGRGPCAHYCHNTVGSYYCSCRYGYYLSGRHSCPPVDCGRPPIPKCPSNAYSDQFGAACKTISIPGCTTTYLNYCYLNCPSNYRRALIGSSAGKAFAQDYSKVTFTGPSRVRCQGNRYWTSHGTIVKLYCRRNNDPPTDLRLNSLTINEHSPVNTVVGILSSSDYQSWQTHRYTVEHSKGFYIFEIAGTNLRIKIVPRYKSTANGVNSPTNSFEVSIRTTDNGSPNMYRQEDYNIKILDVNDPPTNLRLNTYKVSEKAAIGTTVATLLADDEDSRTTNPCSSWKVDDSSSHSVAFKLGGGNKVVTAKLIDHESQKAHSIVITCVDYDYTSSSGRNKKTASATVIIDITDEHEPPISISLDNDDVDENSKSGTKVGTVTATDQDKETLRFVLVSSSKTNKLDATKKFKVGTPSCSNPNSGSVRTVCTADITVIGTLDYEDIETYNVILFAYDTKNHHISKAFTLKVNDINEAPTDVILGANSVDENSPVNTIVGNLDFEDPDNPDKYKTYPNGSIGLVEDIRQNPSCKVDVGKYDGGSFEVARQYPNFELVVSDSKAFDFETKNKYTVSVTCEDHGRPSLSITKVFTVLINDLNEQPTAITPNPSPMNVKECVGIGTLVAKLSTVDQDKGQTYQYSIVAGNLSVFDIRGNNLVVKADVIDFESEDEYEVTLQTVDNGNPPMVFEDTFVIDVVDCPEPPTDIVWAAGGTLPEQTPDTTPGNTIIGYNIGEVNVIDQDNNQNPQCKLLDDANGLFNVSADNTLVIIAGPRATTIDYESLSDHTVCFKIRCTDSTGLYLDKQLCVDITDVNEPPTNITLNGNRIQENRADVEIGDISVTGDPDVGQDHNCTVIPDLPDEAGHQEDASKDVYIKQVPQGGSFRNVLTTKRGLDYEAISTHSLDVNLRCCDIPTDGQTSLCVEMYDFIVWIEDDNEVPGSPCENLVWHVSEHQPNGTNITDTLRSIDPDNEIPPEDIQNFTQSGRPPPEKQHLAYKLVNERSVPFVYNEQLQQIMVFGYLDHETHPMYTLVINVMDDGKLEDPTQRQSDGITTIIDGVRLNTTYTCTVMVDDENDVHSKYDIMLSPVTKCKSNPDLGAVNENAAPGTVVGTLTTNDPDKNDVHTYKVESTNEADIPFQLSGPNKDRLEVKGGVPLDHELKNQVSMTISSTDQSGYSVSRSFVICVENVNEKPTDVCLVDIQTLEALPSFSVDENEDDAAIGQIIVQDPDRPSRRCPGPNNSPPAAIDPSLSFAYNCNVVSQSLNTLWEEDAFWIDSNLVLKTKRGLNYENPSRRRATVPVHCADASHPLKSPIAKDFTVTVADVNEAPKNFVIDKNFTEYHAVNSSWWFRLKENTQSVIANIRYTDEDAGQDHTYSISSQFDAQFFTLTHKGLGLFELATSGLSAEAHDDQCFDVIVTDNGQPPKSGFKTICFDVLDIPEPATALRLVCADGNIYGRPDGSSVDEKAFTSFNFRPTATFGTAYLRTDCHQIRQVDFETGLRVGTVVALDDDGNGQFVFTLTTYADVFSISPVNDDGNPTSGGAPAFSLTVRLATAASAPKPAQTYVLRVDAKGADGLDATLEITIRTYNECDSWVVNSGCGKMARCVPTLNSYSCQCKAGLVGNPKSNDATTECQPCPVGQESDGKLPPACVDIDECQSNPCQNGAMCNNGDNMFTCTCKIGFTDPLCGTNIDDCSPNPCQNGGICVDLVGLYRCECDLAYTGHNCEQHISSCEDPAVCKPDEICIYAEGVKCVKEKNVAQTIAIIAADSVRGLGIYGAQTHIEVCIGYKGKCPLSLDDAIKHVNEDGRRRRQAVGNRYMARISDVNAWPNNNQKSLIELVLFDRNNGNQPVSPFGPNGTCELLKKTDLKCVNWQQCLDVNRLHKHCNPDISASVSSVTFPSGKTPLLLDHKTASPTDVNVVVEGQKDKDDKSDPFFKTLNGRITIVVIGVAIIIVAAVIVFLIVRNRKEANAYYEEFDEYDDGSVMPDENIDRDLPSMSGSMRQRARPRSGLVNPLYDAMMADEPITGTVDNELYHPSGDIKIREQTDEGIIPYNSDMIADDDDEDPLYDNATIQ